MKTPKIFFPIIAYGGVVHADFMISMSSLFLAMAPKKIVASSITIGFESLISRGRNASAAYTLAGDYTHLMFVDSDVSFDPIRTSVTTTTSPAAGVSVTSSQLSEVRGVYCRFCLFAAAAFIFLL